MKKYAVLVAGGQGTRMKNNIPKQFLSLKSKPVLYYTINSFFRAFADMEIILVLPKMHIETGERIIAEYFPEKNIKIITGGSTRFASVKNGLSQVNEESIVFVHDAVRCLLTDDLIIRCYELAMQKGSAIPVVASKDSVRIVSGDENNSIDRSTVKLVQTPQVFKSDIIIPAFDVEYDDSFTDEATVVEHAGHKVYLIEGEENNIKITHPADLFIAEKIIEASAL